MPRFTKRPVTIEAVQFTGSAESYEECCRLARGQLLPIIGGGFAVPTLEGRMQCTVGDWLIRGIRGECYPCKPDIFAATYEPADPAK